MKLKKKLLNLILRHENHKIYDWEEELKRAIELSQGHLSLYSLTIEPNTPYDIIKYSK